MKTSRRSHGSSTPCAPQSGNTLTATIAAPTVTHGEAEREECNAETSRLRVEREIERRRAAKKDTGGIDAASPAMNATMSSASTRPELEGTCEQRGSASSDVQEHLKSDSASRQVGLAIVECEVLYRGSVVEETLYARKPERRAIAAFRIVGSPTSSTGTKNRRLPVRRDDRREPPILRDRRSDPAPNHFLGCDGLAGDYEGTDPNVAYTAEDPRSRRESGHSPRPTRCLCESRSMPRWSCSSVEQSELRSRGLIETSLLDCRPRWKPPGRSAEPRA